MRIAILTREFEKETAFGGIATFYKHLSKGLEVLGHEVEIFTQGIWKPYTQVVQGTTVHRVVPKWMLGGPRIGGHMGKMPLGAFTWSLAFELFNKLLMEHRRLPFDVVDAHEHLGVGAFVGIRRTLPLIQTLVTPYTILADQGLNGYKKDFNYRLVYIAEKIALKRSQLLRTLSHDVGEKVKKRFKIEQKIGFTYNPIDLNSVKPNTSNMAKRTEVRILYVGRLEQRKGIHLLTESIPMIALSCPEARFTFIGADGPDDKGLGSMKTSVLNRLKACRTDHMVTFHDPVPYDDLIRIYQDHDIVVVPSLYDNSPYTCQEGMSCGKPVISFDSGGAPEYLGDTGIVVKTGDVAGLAKEIGKLVKDSGRREALGKAARARAEKIFGKESVARQSVDLYMEGIALFRKDRA
jgi:hypothetical protein